MRRFGSGAVGAVLFTVLTMAAWQGPAWAQVSPSTIHGIRPDAGTGPAREAARLTNATLPIKIHSVALPTKPHIYTIWYGDWSDNSYAQIIGDLFANLSGSPRFYINHSYFNGITGFNGKPMSGGGPTGFFEYRGRTSQPYSRGKKLGDAEIQDVIQDALSGGLSHDPEAFYVVLTAADVTVTGRNGEAFCSAMCGYHQAATRADFKNAPYAVIPNPLNCSSCEAQTTGPNGNAAADAMASVIVHELDEMVTDPWLAEYFDDNGAESADKCAWTFGTEYKAPNGARANVHLGSRDYLIQQGFVKDFWSPTGSRPGFCAMRNDNDKPPQR